LRPQNGTQVTGQIYYLKNIPFFGTQATYSRRQYCGRGGIRFAFAAGTANRLVVASRRSVGPKLPGGHLAACRGSIVSATGQSMM